MTEPTIISVSSNGVYVIYVTKEDIKNPKVSAYLKDHVHESIRINEVETLRITPYGLFASHKDEICNATIRSHIGFSNVNIIQEIAIK